MNMVIGDPWRSLKYAAKKYDVPLRNYEEISRYLPIEINLFEYFPERKRELANWFYNYHPYIYYPHTEPRYASTWTRFCDDAGQGVRQLNFFTVAQCQERDSLTVTKGLEWTPRGYRILVQVKDLHDDFIVVSKGSTPVQRRRARSSTTPTEFNSHVTRYTGTARDSFFEFLEPGDPESVLMQFAIAHSPLSVHFGAWRGFGNHETAGVERTTVRMKIDYVRVFQPRTVTRKWSRSFSNRADNLGHIRSGVESGLPRLRPPLLEPIHPPWLERQLVQCETRNLRPSIHQIAVRMGSRIRLIRKALFVFITISAFFVFAFAQKAEATVSLDGFDLSCPTSGNEGDTVACTLTNTAAETKNWPVVGILHLSSDANRALVRGSPLDLQLETPNPASEIDGGLWWIGGVLVAYSRFDWQGTASAQASRTVSIVIEDDDEYEGNEIFYVSLASSGSSGVGFLYSNRQAITISASDSASSDAQLKALEISTARGEVPLGFSSDTTSYTATVAYEVTEAVVTPVANHKRATVTVEGKPVDSGKESSTVPFRRGAYGDRHRGHRRRR